MRVLAACEESQEVCKAFRALGHEAYSCDIQGCSGGRPEWHVQCDALKVIKGGKFTTMDGKVHYVEKWDLLIAHPPCTYLSNAGARHLWAEGRLNPERVKMGIQAKDFFMMFYMADIPKIAIENPVASRIFSLPPYTQIIQPFQFGHPMKKRTCLWLKGLPKLEPTDILPKSECESTKVPGNWYNKGGKERQKNRSKTFPGIAKAMAEQWGGTA